MIPSKSVFVSFATFLLFQGDAVSHPPDRWRPDPPNVSVEFLVGGRPLPQQAMRGAEAFVAVPRWGVEYEIRITNHERHDRVLFAIGVDGLSVIDGSRASERSGGYVLGPGSSTSIRGWRRGLDRVAAFTFTHREDSYAGRTGWRGNIGEVWVWATREESRPPVVMPRAEAAREKAAGRSALSSDGETGTGYGDELIDHVRTTRFVRSDSVRELRFRYGLRPVHEHDYEIERPGGPFAPAPPGWRRDRAE